MSLPMGVIGEKLAEAQDEFFAAGLLERPPSDQYRTLWPTEVAFRLAYTNYAIAMEEFPTQGSCAVITVIIVPPNQRGLGAPGMCQG